MSVIPMTAAHLARDADGFLADYTEWDEDIAMMIAAEEQLELTERHWEVIRFMRRDYAESKTVPTIRRLKKVGGVPTKELYALFPNGPAKRAAKIAGLPKPQGCI